MMTWSIYDKPWFLDIFCINFRATPWTNPHDNFCNFASGWMAGVVCTRSSIMWSLGTSHAWITIQASRENWVALEQDRLWPIAHSLYPEHVRCLAKDLLHHLLNRVCNVTQCSFLEMLRVIATSSDTSDCPRSHEIQTWLVAMVQGFSRSPSSKKPGKTWCKPDMAG